MGFPTEGFTSGLRYEGLPDDILISTYPKCGTTWMQHIVWLILNRGEPLAADVSMTTVVPHLEEVGREVLDALPRPRVIKTHLPFELSPHHAHAKIIYVVRNPFDCAVSFFHHTRGFVKHYDFAAGTFADYFECFVRGEVDFGDYFDNVGSWLKHREQSNLLLISYEDMRSDLRRAIVRIGEFLGPTLGTCVQDEPTLSRIERHASFSHMSSDQQRWSSQRPEAMPPFVRKGIVGDWLNHFTKEQASRLLARLRAAPEANALGELWPQVIAQADAFAHS